MLQDILLNCTFNPEGIQYTREYWVRKCTNGYARTDNGFHFREARN
jgi:hypothetical protein